MFCKHCNKDKAKGEFIRDSSLKNGVKSICKNCYNSKSRERRKQNPDPNSLIRKYSIYE